MTTSHEIPQRTFETTSPQIDQTKLDLIARQEKLSEEAEKLRQAREFILLLLSPGMVERDPGAIDHIGRLSNDRRAEIADMLTNAGAIEVRGGMVAVTDKGKEWAVNFNWFTPEELNTQSSTESAHPDQI